MATTGESNFRRSEADMEGSLGIDVPITNAEFQPYRRMIPRLREDCK